MNVADLITEWLKEAGEDALAARVAKKLAGNEFAQKPVAFDPGAALPCEYITKWGHEHSFVRLDAESF